MYPTSSPASSDIVTPSTATRSTCSREKSVRSAPIAPGYRLTARKTLRNSLVWMTGISAAASDVQGRDAACHRHDREHRIDPARLREQRGVGDYEVFMIPHAAARVGDRPRRIASQRGRPHLMRRKEGLAVWSAADLADACDQRRARGVVPALSRDLERAVVERHDAPCP